MPDPFAGFANSLNTPARSGFAVTPSDVNDFLTSGVVPKLIYVGGTGSLVVQMMDDAGNTTLATVAAGAFLHIRPRKILATGTTATGIVAFT
jgi:hypothetical protein